MPEKIRVVSIDYDGCLSNKNYYYDPNSENDIIHHNQVLNNSLAEKAALFTKTICIIGSIRQSKKLDDEGIALQRYHPSIRIGSCFQVIKGFSEYHKATFDPFLLADIYGNLPDGESFRRATDPDYKDAHADCIGDDTKLTLLYAQMHKFANENPDKLITFEFYDDLVDITDELFRYFQSYPELIPFNVGLSINRYAGETITPMSTIQGIGIIDENYKQTVVEMTNIVAEFYSRLSDIYPLPHIMTTRLVKPWDLYLPIPLNIDLSNANTKDSSNLALLDDKATPKTDAQFQLERKNSPDATSNLTFFSQSPLLELKEASDATPLALSPSGT